MTTPTPSDNDSGKAPRTGFLAIAKDSLLRVVRRPLMWIGFFGLPLFIFIFVASMMHEGLPTKIPAAIVDRDGSRLSRELSQTLAGMQMVDVTETPDSYTQARHLMQEGKIYGFFLIPENFQEDLLDGKKPAISFYTNTVFFVPASLLFKTFKTTAVYTKAGVAATIVQDLGQDPSSAAPLLQPVNIQTRGIGNPLLNYGIYLSNSFMPAVLELMILLMTAFTLGEVLKRHRGPQLLSMARGSVTRAVTATLFPQTIIWWAIAIFMESWLYGWNGYTMHGSWFWMTLSELLYVLACQGMAVFIFGLVPNLRLALSVCSLLGILAFSLAAFSFPEQSMYPAISVFAWLMPVRYNFLIYSEQALNGLDIFYSRVWFAVYFIYMLLPFTVLWRIKREWTDNVYAP